MEKHELKKYKNILKQGLSIREASRILKIVPTTIYRRLKKLRETGDIVHGNGIHQKRLIPLLHLDGVKNMQDANKYFENYIVEHNTRFSKQPLLGNAHKPLTDYTPGLSPDTLDKEGITELYFFKNAEKKTL